MQYEERVAKKAQIRRCKYLYLSRAVFPEPIKQSWAGRAPFERVRSTGYAGVVLEQ